MADELPPGFVSCVAAVTSATWVTPRRRRLTLTGPAIAGMELDDGPAPAVRLLIPPAGEPVQLPTVSAAGLAYPEGATPPTPRTLTIRRFDRAARCLDVDVVTGHDGVASEWAAGVEVGATVGVAGPRNFAPLPAAARYVLLGDDSAIPAVEVLLERSIPAGAEVAAVVEADHRHHRPEAGRITWLDPGDQPGEVILERLDALVPPGPDVVVWVAGESTFVRTARSVLRDRPAPPGHVRAAGYWRRHRSSTELDDQLLTKTRELIAAGAGLDVLDEFALAVPD